jgi:hypothetical protein
MDPSGATPQNPHTHTHTHTHNNNNNNNNNNKALAALVPKIKCNG